MSVQTVYNPDQSLHHLTGNIQAKRFLITGVGCSSNTILTSATSRPLRLPMLLALLQSKILRKKSEFLVF